jgi:hypothetical protein
MSNECQSVFWLWFFVWYLWAAGTFIRAQWFMICPPNPPGDIKSKWIFAGYDMWIGTFVDKNKKHAYWFPIPFVGKKYWRE